MFRRRWFASIPFAVLIATGCVFDVDDDGDDNDTVCIEECDEVHGSCSVDCDDDDDACRLSCTGERDECRNDCD